MKKVITTKGEYIVDLVIMCIRIRPNIKMFKGQLEMLNNWAILVDEYMRTSNKDILAAVIDVVKYNPTGEYRYIPLATNAIRMGTLVGLN